MIITIDTSVLVRGTLRSRGPARKVLQKIADHPAHVLALSPYILTETGKVLSYSRMHAVLRIPPEEVHA